MIRRIQKKHNYYIEGYGKTRWLCIYQVMKAYSNSKQRGTFKIYKTSEKYGLKMSTKVARTINKTLYLDSLMNKNRYVESYLFNLTNNVNSNQNNENILSMAIGQVSQNNI